jgi:hypothetical protein
LQNESLHPCYDYKYRNDKHDYPYYNQQQLESQFAFKNDSEYRKLNFKLPNIHNVYHQINDKHNQNHFHDHRNQFSQHLSRHCECYHAQSKNCCCEDRYIEITIKLGDLDSNETKLDDNKCIYLEDNLIERNKRRYLRIDLMFRRFVLESYRRFSSLSKYYMLAFCLNLSALTLLVSIVLNDSQL